MKKVFYVIGIIIFLAICYIFVNFFYFDSWACHSSEKQLNNYVKHEDTKKLKEVAKDNKTYQFLKKQNKISIDGKSDNQGSGHIGYYRIDINGKPASLFIKIKYCLLYTSPSPRDRQKSRMPSSA